MSSQRHVPGFWGPPLCMPAQRTLHRHAAHMHRACAAGVRCTCTEDAMQARVARVWCVFRHGSTGRKCPVPRSLCNPPQSCCACMCAIPHHHAVPAAEGRRGTAEGGAHPRGHSTLKPALQLVLRSGPPCRSHAHRSWWARRCRGRSASRTGRTSPASGSPTQPAVCVWVWVPSECVSVHAF